MTLTITQADRDALAEEYQSPAMRQKLRRALADDRADITTHKALQAIARQRVRIEALKRALMAVRNHAVPKPGRTLGDCADALIDIESICERSAEI